VTLCAGVATRAALAEEIEESPTFSTEASTRGAWVLAMFEEYVTLHRRIPNEVIALVQGADSVSRQAYGIAAHLAVRVETRQTLLEAPTIPLVLDAITQVLASEIELLRLERKLDEEVRGSLFQNQREFYLQEQLKAIHRELGEEDGDDALELGTRSRPASFRDRQGAGNFVLSRRMSPVARVHRRPYSSTGSSRCRGPSARTTCSTSRTPVAFSTKIITASRK
jgi:ATP-dependent Lon protease